MQHNLYDFIDRQVTSYHKQDGNGKTIILMVMIDYYDTVLKLPEFNVQREYCYDKMLELCPSFFNSNTKIKSNANTKNG